MIYHFFLLFLIVIIYLAILAARLPKEKSRKYCAIGMGVCLFLFAALRSWKVGSDTWNYYAGFIHDSDMDYLDLLLYYQGRDPFFHFFQRTFAYVSTEPQIFIAFVAGIISICFSVFAYFQKSNILVLYTMYITLRMYAFSLSGMRQAIALSFVFIAFVLLQRKRPWYYFVSITLLASLFHSSAFVFILAYPIAKFKHTKIVVATMLTIGIANVGSGGQIASVFANYIFGNRFQGYLSHDFAFGASSTFLIYVAIFIWMMISYKMLTRLDKDNSLLISLSSVGLMFSILGQALPNLFRLSYYYILPLYSIFAILLDQKSKKDKSSLTRNIVIIVLMAQYVIMGAGAGTDNYEFFWDDPYVYSGVGLYD